MKQKKMFKNIILMSVVLIAAMIALMCFFMIAEKAIKELIAFIVCVGLLVIFGVVNAG